MYSEVDKLVSYVSRGIAPKYTEEMDASILVINQKCIRDFSLNFKLARRHDLSKKKINELKILQNHDVVVNSTGVGTLGRVAQFNSLSVKASFDSHVTVLRPNEDKIDPIYFGYLIKSKQSTIESFAEGSTGQTELSKSAISSMGLKYIEGRKEQKLIANFLLSLDRKIALNKKMNATLEAMAQALFKSWFVDFDPVKAKLAAVRSGRDPEKAAMAAIACKLVVPPGKPKPDNLEEKLPSAEAIDAAIASLETLSEEQMLSLKEKAAHFPSDFIESELGLIPQGWEIKSLSEVGMKLESGKRPKGGIDKNAKSGIPSVGAESLFSVGEYDYSKERLVPLEFAKKASKGWVKDYDVAVYKDGAQVGDPSRIALYGKSFPYSRFMVNEHVFLIRCEKIGQPFLYHLFKTSLIYEKLKAMGTSKAAQPGLNQGEVNSCKFIFSDVGVLNLYNDILIPQIEFCLEKGKESRLLSLIRDLLIPKLLSGEISVASD